MATGADQIFVERTREALAILGVGGGGGLSSYALVGRSGSDNAQTTNVSAGDHLEFNFIIEGNGVSVSGAGGSQDQANGLIELESGGIWLLVGTIGVDFSDAAGSVNFRWRNNTAGVDFNPSTARMVPPSNTGFSFRNNVATALLNIAAPAQVELRLASAINIGAGGFPESFSSGMRALILKVAA